MPETFGAVYVWNNSPEFMLYVMKDGKPIFADKTWSAPSTTRRRCSPPT